MKIISVTALAIPDIRVIRFARFQDERGYFTEPFRKTDFCGYSGVKGIIDTEFVQVNESFSLQGVIRGLHFQWNPFMGKLVRTIQGRMVDIVLDIRKGSPTLGKALLHDMSAPPDLPYGEWIWVPAGFAHGNFFSGDTHIEYFCTGEYSSGNEAGISPFAPDIDWSLADARLKREFDVLGKQGAVVSEKDKNGLSFGAWMNDERSNQFDDTRMRGKD
jgi:dTDP-4-dehydrorhamnose 3,5-epimerase